MDDTSIRTAVTSWLENAAAAEANYGHISTWDTGGVTDMSYLFNGRPDYEQYKAGAQYFNENISAWQTSGVTNMRSMFTYAYAFDQPIGGWNVGLVTSMRDMFHMAIVFNQPLNGWDVANVKDMWYMFGFARVFNQPLGDWNVGSVTLIRDMFNGAWAFNQALDSWDLSAVWHMGWMFWEAYSFDQVLGWCVDNGVYMDSAFGSTACESTACGVVQGGCTQAPTTNYWGTGNGWCSSDLDELIGSTSDASACWTMCENTYGSDLMAIDWTPDGECYCQDDCQCTLAGSCMSAKVCIGQTRRRIAARTTTTLRRSTALARMRKSTRFVLMTVGSAAPMWPKRARGLGRTVARGTTRIGETVSPIIYMVTGVTKIFYKCIPTALGTTQLESLNRSCAVPASAVGARLRRRRPRAPSAATARARRQFTTSAPRRSSSLRSDSNSRIMIAQSFTPPKKGPSESPRRCSKSSSRPGPSSRSLKFHPQKKKAVHRAPIRDRSSSIPNCPY